MLISLDAMELSLVEKGVAEGWLPVLAGLFEKGAGARLVTEPSLLPGATWPTTLTGRPPHEHLVIFDRQLRPGSYRIDDVTGNALRCPPFWRYVSDAGRRSTVVSIYGAPRLEGFRGTQVLGWGTPDPFNAKTATPWADPPEVLQWLGEACPGRRSGFLDKVPGTPAELTAFVERTVRGVEEQARGLGMLLERTEWDLFFGNFGEPHEAGHLLWHLGLDGLGPVYRALDAAVGTLLELAGDDVTAMVLTPHGMGDMDATYGVTPGVLARSGFLVEGTDPRSAGDRARRLLTRARAAAHRVVPLAVRQALGRAAAGQRRQLEAATRLANVDWSSTTAFTLAHDNTSLVRVNLAGREPRGTVAADAYDDVCDEITRVVGDLVDDGGSRAAATTFRMDEVTGAPVGDVLPDLVVTWKSRGTAAVRSQRVGTVPVPTDDPRTGDHVPRGFLVGVGPGIVGSGDGPFTAPDGTLLDVGPTVLARLGLPVPPELPGRPISGLAPAPGGPG